MNRITLLLLVATACALGSPAWGQSVGGARQIEKWVVDLGDEDQDVRIAAALSLCDRPSRAASAIPILIEALAHKNSAVRREAATALSAIGSPAVPALTTALGSEDGQVRYYASVALGEMGREAAPAVPALAKNLSHENLWARHGAARALGEIGPMAAPAIPALVDSLSSPDHAFSGHATEALGHIGEGLKRDGTVLGWVVPHAYWKELTVLILALGAWFFVAGWRLRQRPARLLEQLAVLAAISVPPTVIAGCFVCFALTREWAQGFLPDLPMNLLPVPAAAVLSVCFCTVLASVWTVWRRPLAVEPSLEPPTPQAS